MKRVFIAIAALLIASVTTAQQVYRSEFSTFDIRESALKNDHSKCERYRVIAPKLLEVVDKVDVFGQTINIPVAWSDFNVYLHLQNTLRAYDLVINEKLVASVEDTATPADFLLSPYLRQGENEILILARQSAYPALESGTQHSSSTQFEGSYLFAQHRKLVYDYDASITMGEDGKKLMFNMDVIVRNDFNVEETVFVGYDIYTPDKKVADYGTRELSIPGHGVDTLRMQFSLGEEGRFLWSEKNTSLYRVTLYIRRDGKPREYITFNVGAGVSTYADGKILRNGSPIAINSAKFNVKGSYDAVLAEIKALQAKGINTLLPDNPQPEWFYDICDSVGMYVIERANINPVEQSQNRKIGGTPSNNPALVGEYLKRVKSMYYRTRNHTCIIAYYLGGDAAGNGYNMYKAYQWLKSVEKNRAIICTSADGEWNTDI